MDKDQIMELIQSRAASYVPEWRFDEEFPDIGTALALVYGDMFSKTVNRFDQIFLKNRIAFLNALDAGLLPARPAEGYVSFGLVSDEVQGVELPAGTVVNCREQDLHYRTGDDVYVSPAAVSSIFFTSDREDFISQPYQGGKMEEIPLFDLSGKNLQEHMLYFGHSQALYIKKGGWIRLELYKRGDQTVSESLLKKLADPCCARFSYYTEAGWQEFEELSVSDGALLLRKGDEQPAFALFEEDGAGGFCIRCQALDLEGLESLYLSGIQMKTWSGDLIPDCVYANGVESSKNRYFPFGERLTPFNEVYFGCEEALCKRGARITLAFHLDFAKIPLDYNIENDPVKWEWIMKRSDFRADPEHDVTIEEVIWEYYNGTGWARLFPDERFSQIFLPGELTQGLYRKVEFTCPADMEPLTVNSCRSWYIRARVVKVNNLFKMKGNYFSPVMENTVFSYSYEDMGVEPEGALLLGGLERKRLAFPASPFVRTGIAEETLYFGFFRPLERGPLKMLFQFREETGQKEDEFLWEYFDGGRWREMSLLDETGGFSRTGLITLMGPPSMERARCFGADGYWLRVRDIGGVSGREGKGRSLPVLMGIHMNTVRITGVDRSDTEYFRMEVFQENTRFRLLHKRVIRAEVYVNEVEHVSSQELERLVREGNVRPVYEETGILKEAWVRWRRRPDFSESGEDDRDYVLDQNEGTILFGNGRRGRIPPAARKNNIRVEYVSGGGERTNLPAGAVNQMDTDVGFISRVSNPLPLCGGCNVETLDAAVRRSCGALRHQNRAITARDYEELAMAASRDILEAKCFPGWDREGNRRPGTVTLVLFRREHGASFDQIRKEAEGFLDGKVEEGLLASDRLALIEPEFVELSVRVQVTVRDFNLAFSVKREIAKRLERFLDPLKGNFRGQGWEIGRLPGTIQIKNAIAGTPGMAFVRGIYISAFAKGVMGRREVDLEHMSRRKYVLPVNGNHEIFVEAQ